MYARVRDHVCARLCLFCIIKLDDFRKLCQIIKLRFHLILNFIMVTDLNELINFIPGENEIMADVINNKLFNFRMFSRGYNRIFGL